MIQKTFPVLLFIIALDGKAKSIDSKNQILLTKDNPEYIEKFKSIITLKTNFGTNGLNYSITPQRNALLANKNIKAGQVNYIPYNPFIAGVSFNLYGLLNLSYKFNPVKSNSTQQSSYNDFSLGYYGRWFFVEGYYNQYTDLYYSTGPNRYKIDASNFNTDLRFFSIGFNNFFVFNAKKYSYNAAFSQSAIQKKSAGTFMLINYYNYSQTISGLGLIPTSVSTFYPNLNGLKTNRQITYSLSPGYGYTFAQNNFYAAFNLFAGPGWQMQRYTTFTKKEFDAALGLFSRLKIGIGFNHPRFFTGLYFNSERLSSSLKDISTRQNLYNFGAFIGGRFIKNKKKDK